MEKVVNHCYDTKQILKHKSETTGKDIQKIKEEEAKKVEIDKEAINLQV